MNQLFTELNNAINAKKSKLFTTDTQLRNFKVKLLYWCANDFSSVIEKLDKQENVTIVINHELSKHEKIFVRILADCGATILLISKDFDNEIGIYSTEVKSEVQTVNFGTNEKIAYTREGRVNTQITCASRNSLCKYDSLDSVEQSLYDDKKIVKVIVSGMNNYIDTCNFYAKLNE